MGKFQHDVSLVVILERSRNVWLCKLGMICFIGVSFLRQMNLLELTTSTKLMQIQDNLVVTGVQPKQIPLSQLTLEDEESYDGNYTNSENGINITLQCPLGQSWISNVERNTSTIEPNLTKTATAPLIPKRIHQTCKSRCVSNFLINATKTWQQLDGWSYYLHDDAAMIRLLHSEKLLLDFPHLRYVADHCITSGTIRADLWRYLVLWEYGGIYADIDSTPNPTNFDPVTTIKPTDEAFFVVEMYGLLSQYFLASRPRHPILWYTINDALIQLLSMQDTGAAPAHAVTGPHALHRAFMQYRKDVNVTVTDEWSQPPPIPVGDIFIGTENTTITVVGNMSHPDHIIIRDATSDTTAKGLLYKEMGMTHYHEQKWKTYSNETCLSAIRRQKFS